MVAQPAPLVELRRYTLKPGRKEELKALFDAYFTRGQEQLGIQVRGPFYDDDAPDQIVWMRAFEDLESRHRALTSFYSGPVWASHGSAANETMVDSDDVHLLEPFPRGRDLATPFAGQHPAISQMWVAVLHHRSGGLPHADDVRRHVSGSLRGGGTQNLGWFRTSSQANTFTGLPVRQDQALVCVSEFAGPAAAAGPRAHAAAVLDNMYDGSGWHADVSRLVSGVPR